MNTVILPGYSAANKIWGEQVGGQIANSQLIYWDHWGGHEPKPNWKEEQAKNIRETHPEIINLLAKSIGTVVVGKVVMIDPNLINKIILCGIPINDLGDNYVFEYDFLRTVPSRKVLVIQNEQDRHGTFAQVKELLASINPEIRIISRPGDNHDYLYFEDFFEFLNNE